MDSNGNTTTITDALGHETTIAYDSEGRQTSVTDPLSKVTSFTYDDNGNLTSVTDPLSRTTHRSFDVAGRVTTVTDPLGATTKYAYDNLNELTATTDALNEQTSFAYDGNGNLTSLTDTNGHTTSYTYDDQDRIASRTDPLSRGVSFAYDGNGNLTQFTDRRGKVTVYTYDHLNRRTFAGFGHSGSTNESAISYTYDAGNRMTEAVDSTTGTLTRSYDGLDRLTEETTPQGTIDYVYDVGNRRASMTVEGQTEVDYSYDNANRLTQIAQGTPTVSFTYDNANRRTSLTLPNGVTMSYSYDDASQLTEITYATSTTTLGNLTYTYDLAGRRTSMGGSFAATNLPMPISATSYDAANELTQWGTATPLYDSNGNTTSDGTNSYVWDARNHLASMNSGADSFQYDPFGRRVAKTIVGATTNFLYDGPNSVQELSGGTVTANLLGGFGMDERFVRTDSSGAENFLTDGLSGTLALTDNSATTLADYTYDPFGATSSSGSSTNTYEYAARENDGVGVYFYRARYYSPAISRFISEDPTGFNGGSTNLYGYAADNPVNLTDPSGQNPACVVGGLLGTMAYNSYVIYQSLAGRKASYYAGLSGFGHIASGNIAAFGAGCGAGWLAAPFGFAVPAGTGAVYGGGSGAALAAAQASGLNLIQDTIGGQIAANLTAGASESLSNWVWDYASAQFASSLEGTVTVFEGSFGDFGEFAAKSDLVTVELPILQQAWMEGTVNLVPISVP